MLFEPSLALCFRSISRTPSDGKKARHTEMSNLLSSSLRSRKLLILRLERTVVTLRLLTGRRDYQLVKNWAPEDWRRQDTALTEDSTSRRLGRPVNIPPVETTNFRLDP